MKDGNGNLVLTDEDKIRGQDNSFRTSNVSIRARNHKNKCGFSWGGFTCSREFGHPGTEFDHSKDMWFGHTKSGEFLTFEGNHNFDD